MVGLYLLIALLLLLLNAFFVLAEFAAVKTRASRVEELARAGDSRARLMRHIQTHLDEYLSVCQVGITLASIGLGFVGEPAFARLLESEYVLQRLMQVATPKEILEVLRVGDSSR